MTTHEVDAVGVLANPYLKHWQVEALERLLEMDGLSIPLVFVDDSDREQADAVAEATDSLLSPSTLQLGVELLSEQRAWTLVLAERELARRLGETHSLRRRHPIAEVSCLKDASVRRVSPQREGGWTEFPPAAVRALEESCDVAVRFGFGLVRGDILTAPDHGLLSFHSADVRRYRGLGPPAAFYEGRTEIRPTLQRLTEEIDGGEIIAQGRVDVSDCATLWDVYEEVYARQITLLSEGIENLRSPEFDPEPPDELGAYYPMDSRYELSFAATTAYRNVVGRLKRALQ